MYPESIFPNFQDHNLMFFGAFHLGIPLSICQTPKSKEWSELKNELTETFSKNSRLFDVVDIKFDVNNNFPLGKPFMLKHKDFFNIFNLQKFFNETAIEVQEKAYSLDHIIWVCPSGIVLILGQMTSKNGIINLNDFSMVIERHYAELAYIFTEVAEIIINMLPNSITEELICCKPDIEKCKKGISKRKDLTKSNEFDYNIVSDQLNKDKYARELYYDILIDVYYIEFQKKQIQTELEIHYIYTRLISDDAEFLFMIAVAFCSFVGLLWLQKHLNEQIKLFQKALVGHTPFKNEVAELKLFHIFCLQLINESRPISIRLTQRYMEALEKFWEQERLHDLVKQVDEQLKTLEEMFKWRNEIDTEHRNTKMGIAAVFLSIISITAVVSQLISTIDITSPPYLDGLARTGLIFIGFIIGAISTVAVYLLPIFRYPIKKRRHRK